MRGRHEQRDADGREAGGLEKGAHQEKDRDDIRDGVEAEDDHAEPDLGFDPLENVLFHHLLLTPAPPPAAAYRLSMPPGR